MFTCNHRASSSGPSARLDQCMLSTLHEEIRACTIYPYLSLSPRSIAQKRTCSMCAIAQCERAVHCTLTLASALHSLPAQLHTGTRLKCIHTSRLRTFTCTSTHSGSRPHRTISATLPPPGPPKTHLHTAQSVEDWVSGQPWCTVGASTHDDVIGNRPGPRGPDPAAIASTLGANRSVAGSVHLCVHVHGGDRMCMHG